MDTLACDNYPLDALKEQRFAGNMLTDSSWFVALILFLYIYFAFVWGPNLVKERGPYKLKWLIAVYNISQILWNAYIFSFTRFGHYLSHHYKSSIMCVSVDAPSSPAAQIVSDIGVLYFSKEIYSLLHTVFIVLRKSDHEISFQHIVNHIFMVVGTWLGLKYLSGGVFIYIGALCSVTNMIVYTYYLLSLMELEWVQRWKINVTRAQMGQIGLVLITIFMNFFDGNCKSHRYGNAWILPFVLYFMYSIFVFYNKRYLIGRRQYWYQRILARDIVVRNMRKMKLEKCREEPRRPEIIHS